MKHCYMACDNDLYELPRIIGTAREVAAFVGMTVESFYCALKRQQNKRTRYKVYRINLEE